MRKIIWNRLVANSSWLAALIALKMIEVSDHTTMDLLRMSGRLASIIGFIF
jgi:hypothetical protein